MDQPTTSKARSTLPNTSLGLVVENDEMAINQAVFRFVHAKKQAPIPKRNVGSCQTMRERVLQMSLFPDIYDKRGGTRHIGNVDMGESHGY